MTGWHLIVIALTMILFTGAGIYQERREVFLRETAYADALLAHLADMPEFQSDIETASSRLAMMRRFLGPVGSDVAIVPHSDTSTGSGSDGNEDYLATRQLSLAEGLFDLHYRGNPRLLRELMVRSAERHLVLGLLALVSLVAGTERILRRNLVKPLKKLSHQINRMRDGGGWLPCLPETDTELAGLSQAIVDLGPGLERQIYEWIGAERRSAVALVLNDMENRVREPHRHALSLIEELQACETLSREQAMKFRRLRADLHDIHEALIVGEKTFP